MDIADPTQLISDCMNGDETAVEAFVRQYESAVFRFALSILNDSVEAGEITQDTFIAALKSLPSYRERSSLKAWLYKIALNKSLSALRKRNVVDRLKSTLANIFQVEAQKAPKVEDVVIQNERDQAIYRSLNLLDEKHRTVIVLRYFHELSAAEIAEILSIQEGTVHSRLHNAREKLRDALAPLYGE